jgi:hypothetical protein
VFSESITSLHALSTSGLRFDGLGIRLPTDDSAPVVVKCARGRVTCSSTSNAIGPSSLGAPACFHAARMSFSAMTVSFGVNVRPWPKRARPLPAGAPAMWIVKP